MIPIKYRLENNTIKNDEDEYIQIVLCNKDIKPNAKKPAKPKKLPVNTEAINNVASILLDDFFLSKEGTNIKKELATKINDFQRDYKNFWQAALLITLPFNYLKILKEFINKNYISPYTEVLYNENLALGEKQYYSSYSSWVKACKVKHKNGDKTYLEERHTYHYIVKACSAFLSVYKSFSSKNINNWIVDTTGITVCPYCNIAYTYNRGESKASAQLDHFFPKDEYPMLALCFYNLIPSCPTCNRIKSDQLESMVSPYENDAFKRAKITWKFNTLNKYGSSKTKSMKDIEEEIAITVTSKDKMEELGFTLLQLDDAYSNHRDIASELLRKIAVYSNIANRKTIIDTFSSLGITDDEINLFYFGNYLDADSVGKRSMAKMTHDFYKEYMSYTKREEHLKRTRGKKSC